MNISPEATVTMTGKELMDMLNEIDSLKTMYEDKCQEKRQLESKLNDLTNKAKEALHQRDIAKSTQSALYNKSKDIYLKTVPISYHKEEMKRLQDKINELQSKSNLKLTRRQSITIECYV